MKWRPYKDYTATDIPGLEQIPAHWEVRKLKLIAEVRGGVAKGKDLTGQETVRVPYLRVANVQNGYLNLSEVEEIEIPERELPRYLLQPGDVLMNEGGDFDKLGRGCVWNGEVSPCIHQNHVFSVRPHGVRPEWLSTVSGSAYAQFFFMGRAKQSTNLASISATNLAELPVVMPPAGEQDRMLDFLDRETAKIDALIEEQQRVIESLNEKIVGLASKAITDKSLEWIRMRHVCEEVSRPLVQEAGEEYVPLGLFNRGRGLFHKDPRTEDEMGDSDFFWVEPDDLIFSGQFAWEGAVALAGIEEKGCVVSHRYPIIRGDGIKATTEYLYALFLTDFGNYLLNENSRGAAGRNRPLNIGSLLKEKIPVPGLPLQGEINFAIAFRKPLLQEANRFVALLQEHRSALITAAVTGKIDVREVQSV